MAAAPLKEGDFRGGGGGGGLVNGLSALRLLGPHPKSSAATAATWPSDRLRPLPPLLATVGGRPTAPSSDRLLLGAAAAAVAAGDSVGLLLRKAEMAASERSSDSRVKRHTCKGGEESEE